MKMSKVLPNSNNSKQMFVCTKLVTHKWSQLFTAWEYPKKCRSCRLGPTWKQPTYVIRDFDNPQKPNRWVFPPSIIHSIIKYLQKAFTNFYTVLLVIRYFVIREIFWERNTCHVHLIYYIVYLGAES
jgi:hypothetical protein